MEPVDTLEIQHEPERSRFVAHVAGMDAFLLYRSVNETTLDYYRTFVPPPLRGRGIASELTACALRHAVRHGRRVVPTCSFVARYVDRHPEFHSALA